MEPHESMVWSGRVMITITDGTNLCSFLYACVLVISDMYAYDLLSTTWRSIACKGMPPSPRHSHSVVIYKDAMYIFGGYDGSYRNDLHQFDFQTSTWSQVATNGDTPRCRYRCTCVIFGDNMILHGGHDGTVHLQDTYLFRFDTLTWSALTLTDGIVPSPRDSHIAVVHNESMFIYGGSTGSAVGDFHELNLETLTWSLVDFQSNSTAGNGNGSRSPSKQAASGGAGSTSALLASSAVNPGSRFCHVGVVHDSCMYIFGGYDGERR
jgi:leucine-zipper-like transcriptional regulator 1